MMTHQELVDRLMAGGDYVELGLIDEDTGARRRLRLDRSALEGPRAWQAAMRAQGCDPPVYGPEDFRAVLLALCRYAEASEAVAEAA